MFANIALAFSLSTAPGVEVSSKQSREQVPVQVDAVLACQLEANSQRRLACYDATVSKLAAAARAGEVMVINREELRKTRRSLFGFAIPKIAFAGDDDSSAEPEQVEAKVQSAQDADYGRWLVVLDNGAVWQTTEVERRMPLPKPGQVVRIRKGALGSYMLSVNGTRGLRAMRLR